MSSSSGATRREELLRQLAFINNDPGKRLEAMLERGLVRDAEQALRAMVAEATVLYCQDLSRVDCYQIGGADGPKQAERGFAVCVGRKGENSSPRCAFTPNGLMRAFRWTKSATNAFMVKVLHRAVEAIDPTNLQSQVSGWMGSWEIRATVRAMELFLPKTHELRKQVELWCLRAWFFHDMYLFTYFSPEDEEAYLGLMIEKKRTSIYDHHLLEHQIKRAHNVMEAFVARLRELGMTDARIREDLYVWLERFGARGFDPELIAAVANASVLREWQNDVRTRRDQILVPSIAPYVERMLSGEARCHPLAVAALMDGGLINAAHEEAKTIFCAHAAEQLSRGRIGLVAEVVALVGHRFFGTADLSSGHGFFRSKVNFDLATCAAMAFDKAWQNNRFGIAAALVLTFGEKACLDAELLRERAEKLAIAEDDGEGADAKLAELVAERKTQIATALDLARSVGEKIALDYAPVFAAML